MTDVDITNQQNIENTDPSLVEHVEPSTVEPTVEPTIAPTIEPTVAPTIEPIITPTIVPTVAPTVASIVAPTVAPTNVLGDENFSFYTYPVKHDSAQQKLKRRFHSIINKCEYDNLIKFLKEIPENERHKLDGILSNIDNTTPIQHALYKGWIDGFAFLLKQGFQVKESGTMFPKNIILSVCQKDENICLKCFITLANLGCGISQDSFNQIYQKATKIKYTKFLTLLQKSIPDMKYSEPPKIDKKKIMSVIERRNMINEIKDKLTDKKNK
ncbi:MAG: hypothetical protein Edafosvirus6_4 [Edafosvirus sp.]|uniref:Uncharacterized protein n=1 Tax=Edafosvirus sp. TaxID=2487765 RepID=A0A3G4ZTD6_9VIRU|nr:MAG: hypothetical protein Edafosvirus6_4 [Edafosvirus sp.]